MWDSSSNIKTILCIILQLLLSNVIVPAPNFIHPYLWCIFKILLKPLEFPDFRICWEWNTDVVLAGSASATKRKWVFSSFIPISGSVSNHCYCAFCFSQGLAEGWKV